MPRRIAFLFNSPLADNTAWKQHLIRALQGRHMMLVVFCKTYMMDYARTLALLREKCEMVVLQLYTEFFRDPAKYEQTARLGREGKTYYAMNRLLKRQVLEGIKAARFSRSQSAAGGRKVAVSGPHDSSISSRSASSTCVRRAPVRRASGPGGCGPASGSTSWAPRPSTTCRRFLRSYQHACLRMGKRAATARVAHLWHASRPAPGS
jgi:hypothetical protein